MHLQDTKSVTSYLRRKPALVRGQQVPTTVYLPLDADSDVPGSSQQSASTHGLAWHRQDYWRGGSSRVPPGHVVLSPTRLGARQSLT